MFEVCYGCLREWGVALERLVSSKSYLAVFMKFHNFLRFQWFKRTPSGYESFTKKLFFFPANHVKLDSNGKIFENFLP